MIGNCFIQHVAEQRKAKEKAAPERFGTFDWLQSWLIPLVNCIAREMSCPPLLPDAVPRKSWDRRKLNDQKNNTASSSSGRQDQKAAPEGTVLFGWSQSWFVPLVRYSQRETFCLPLLPDAVAAPEHFILTI